MSYSVEDVKVGTWIRFQKNGVLVIGVVQYLQRHSYYSDAWIAVTDVGTIDVSSILEVRQ